MIIIWGTTRRGKIDTREGQYALTRFAHVYWLPLFPVGAVWITRDGYGHSMKMSGRGVAAGYARTWGPILGAVGVAGAGGMAGFVVALAAVSTAALSLSWRKPATKAAERKSDMNQLAFGTRCEPSLMPDELLVVLRPELEARWRVLSNGETPTDVARFGTDDPARAAAAYGVLRITALTLPATQRVEAEADASRIAEGLHDVPLLTEGGPYRNVELPPERR
jgi:hypothetical protein